MNTRSLRLVVGLLTSVLPGLRSSALVLSAVGCLLFATGCNTAVKNVGEIKEVLVALDQLDLAEVHVPGRATTTHYTREEKDGVITSTLTHNNPSLSEPIKIVRKRPAAAVAK